MYATSSLIVACRIESRITKREKRAQMKFFTKLTNKIFETQTNITHQAERKKNLEKAPQKPSDTLALKTDSSIFQSSPSSPILEVPRQTVHFAEEPSRDISLPSNVPWTTRFSEVKSEVFEGLKHNYVSSKVTLRLSCLLTEKPHSSELLILRAIAHRLRKEMRPFIKDCNAILALDASNRFALLHRLCAASSEIIEHDVKSSDYIEYFQAAYKYIESAPDDRLCLFIKTIWLEDNPRSFEILTKLRKMYMENPKDIYLGSVLMSAILSRSQIAIDVCEMREIKINAGTLLAYDENNALAHQVLYVYFRVPISFYSDSTTSDFTRNFASFPLVHLDKTLPSFIENMDVA
jgi:hypothetical protein